MKSATRGNRLFATNPQVNRPRSTFSRPSDIKTTFEGNFLVPIYWDEVLPGDTFNVKATFFGRLATPIVPIMDNAYLETFWFYCPNRLLWTNFAKQQGEQENPGDSTNFLTPILSNTATASVTVNGLWDYFGHPLTDAPGFTTQPIITALHMRMYNKTWNEWFRDQDYQDSVDVPTGDGPDDYEVFYGLLPINKFHDYITSSRPEPLKGPELNMPVIATGQAPIERVSNAPGWVLYNGGTNTLTTTGQNMNTSGTGNKWSASSLSPGGSISADPSGGLIADLDAASFVGPTLNAFRELTATQRVYEADMRGGTRYNEGIYTHFGVVNPDNRVNRVLFLGSGKSYVNVFQVAQTSETDTGTPQGNLAAYGTINAHGHGFFQSFSEHGFVFGLAAVRADLHYQNIVERMFTRRTRFDYYTPEFANLGEQALLGQEVNFAGNGTTDIEPAAYTERWAEYRFKQSVITSYMRSQAPTSLDVWHLAQDFGGRFPVEVNGTFMQENAPWDRVVAVTDEPIFILNGYVENKTTRVMPIRSVPGLTRI
nr:MAG: major capsid protein [Microvirus sp.]